MATPAKPQARGILTTTMAARKPRRLAGSGIRQIALGFGLVILVGFALLSLPLASTDGSWADPQVALFTAVSAVCVTGLIVVDTPDHWSTFGEVVVMLLIQVGGLGYMVGTTVVLWALGRKLGLRDQNMLRIYYGAPSMSETLSFARSVGLFTLYFEAAGTLALTIAAFTQGEPLAEAAWWGLFHSVSAFNNAGFALTDLDVATYAGSPAVLLTLVLLITAGSLGYLPIAALATRRSFRRLPLDHKLILSTAAVLLVLGVTFTAAAEWTNDRTLGAMPVADRPIAALFHTANRTAGFSVFDVGAMHDETKLATIGLMFVGGAAGSTAGGLKLGAFALLLAVMIASLRGERDVSVFWKRVPRTVIQQATTLALFHVGLIFAFAILLTLGTDLLFIDVLFEAVSAICTVGFSAAGTLAFGSVGHWILILAMLIGRFAPLMLLLYMTRPRRHVSYHHPEDSVRLG